MERIGRKYILDSSSLLANDDNVIFVEVFVCLVAVLPDKDALLIFLNLPPGGATPPTCYRNVCRGVKSEPMKYMQISRW